LQHEDARMLRIILFIFSFYSVLCGIAQEQSIMPDDSVFIETEEDNLLFREVSDLNPQRAALLSAVLPGLGQIYNKQYWKVPIVCSGLLIFAHYINYNNRIYNTLRNAAIITSAGGENVFGRITNTDGLIRNRDNFRRNRDFLMVLGTAFYLIQIVDAHVAAHLDEFIVNEDLAINIKPSIQSTPLFSHALGVSLVINF